MAPLILPQEKYLQPPPEQDYDWHYLGSEEQDLPSSGLNGSLRHVCTERKSGCSFLPLLFPDQVVSSSEAYTAWG